jgi:hypothetical protein
LGWEQWGNEIELPANGSIKPDRQLAREKNKPVTMPRVQMTDQFQGALFSEGVLQE